MKLNLLFYILLPGRISGCQQIIAFQGQQAKQESRSNFELESQG